MPMGQRIAVALGFLLWLCAAQTSTAQQSKPSAANADRLSAAIDRASQASMRVLDISRVVRDEGAQYSDVARMMESSNRADAISYAYDLLNAADNAATNVLNVALIYELISHPPDRKRIAPVPAKLRDQSVRIMEKAISGIDTKMHFRMASETANRYVDEATKAQRETIEILKAMRFGGN